MRIRLFTLLILSLGLSLSACGDEKTPGDDPGRVVAPEPDAGGAAKDVEGADADTKPSDEPDSDVEEPADVSDGDGSGGSSTPPDFDATRPDTSGPGVSGSCEQVEDLGVLSAGTYPMAIEFQLENDHLQTRCRDLEADTRPEMIYKLRVSEHMSVDVRGMSSYVFELRTDPCGEESSILTCNPRGHINGYRLQPEVDYYLIVENDSELSVVDHDEPGGVGDEEDEDDEEPEYFFWLTLASPFGECSPGMTQCVSADEVKSCQDQGTYTQLGCPSGCVDYTCEPGQESCSSEGSGCAGDSCYNPIPLEDGQASLQGSIAGFSDQLWAYNCAGEATARMVSGRDVVFLARDVQAGQSIQIETSDSAREYTYVIQRGDCGEEVACELRESAAPGELSHQVSEDGDYYIIIDTPGDHSADEVHYQVSVE